MVIFAIYFSADWMRKRKITTPQQKREELLSKVRNLTWTQALSGTTLKPFIGIADFQKTFGIDLKTRKIVPFRDPKAEIPILQVDVNINQAFSNLHLVESSPIQKPDLSQIPEPLAADRFKTYDQDLLTFQGDYFEFLLVKKENETLTDDNPFKKIFDTCQIVMGEIKDLPGLPPLPFPQKLIQHLVQKHCPELLEMEGSGAGTLTPRYSFSWETGSLQLFFTFIDSTKPSEKLVHHEITLAQFDRLSLNSFQEKILSDQKNETDPTEFFLHAFFDKLGMPGKETLEFNGLIAPKMVPFVGLYQLWESYPDAKVVYNGALHTVERNQFLENAIASKEQNIYGKTMLVQLPKPVLGSDYISIWNKVSERKKSLDHKRIEFRKEFMTLFALIKLTSGIDNKSLFPLLDADISLLHPDQQDEIYHRWLLAGKNPSFSFQKVQNLVGMLTTIPSEYVLASRERMQKISQIQSELT